MYSFLYSQIIFYLILEFKINGVLIKKSKTCTDITKNYKNRITETCKFVLNLF